VLVILANNLDDLVGVYSFLSNILTDNIIILWEAYLKLIFVEELDYISEFGLYIHSYF